MMASLIQKFMFHACWQGAGAGAVGVFALGAVVNLGCFEPKCAQNLGSRLEGDAPEWQILAWKSAWGGFGGFEQIHLAHEEMSTEIDSVVESRCAEEEE